MDNQKEFTCVEHCAPVLTKKLDVENDFQQSLPAYAEDIYRIVGCTARNYITSVDINMGEVKLYARCEVCLTYYNDSADLCYAEFEEEYQKILVVDNLSEDAFACAHIHDNYTGCRMINQRRVDVHSSAVIHVTVYDKLKCPCLCSCENSRLKSMDIQTGNVVACHHSRMEFDEEFSLPNASAPIKRIISRSASVNVNEVKIIKDKALIKASVQLTVLYTADNSDSQLQKADYTVQASKIIDVAGVTDTDHAICCLQLGSLYVKAKAAGGELLNAVDVFGEIYAQVLFIRENSVTVITDGYLMNSECRCDYSELQYYAAGRYISENRQIKLNFSVPSEIKEVLQTSLTINAGAVKNGRLPIHAFLSAVCLNLSGDAETISASADDSLELGEGSEALCSVSISSYDYTLTSSGMVEVRATPSLTAYLFKPDNMRVLSDMNAIGDLLTPSCLTVYYGKAEEEIWQIAKSLHADPERITSENDLNGDRLCEDSILMIPGA